MLQIYNDSKKIIAPALNALVGGPSKVIEASYAQIREAIYAPVKRAVKSGGIRKALAPIDLLRALVGVTNVASRPDWQPRAKSWWISSSPVRGQSNRRRDLTPEWSDTRSLVR